MKDEDEWAGWYPRCNLDGTYASKQCRGDRLSGRCFCYSEDGRRIFGWDWYKDASKMTCGWLRFTFVAFGKSSLIAEVFYFSV